MAESNITLNTDLYFPGEGSADWDFIGFTFNGYHFPSEEEDLEGVKIYRVSDGNRYNENLVGAFQDTTTQVPGGDGLYYFRTNYSNYPFNFTVAFDNLSEVGFRKLRRIFNGKAMGPLIFDERPYKAYSVKIQSPPQFKYICFVEDGERVYKGDGTISFISYYPYASSVFKYLDLYDVYNKVNISEFDGNTDYYVFENNNYILVEKSVISYERYDSQPEEFIEGQEYYKKIEDDYVLATEFEEGITYYEKIETSAFNENEEYYIKDLTIYPTKDEWAASSGMLASQGGYDGINASSIKIYNPGDVDTDCIIRIELPVAPQTLSGRTIRLYQGSLSTGTLKKILTLDTIAAKGQDNFIRINSRTNLIEGEYLASGTTKGTITGNLYNEVITSGDFFKIPVCENKTDFYTIVIDSGTIASVEYNYLYY